MITLHFEREKDGALGLSVCGHAGAAVRGADPVCAGVTALCYTLAQALSDQRQLLREDPHICLLPGKGEIQARPKEEGAAAVEHTFRVVWTGLRLLSHNYPEYIKIQ